MNKIKLSEKKYYESVDHSNLVTELVDALSDISVTESSSDEDNCSTSNKYGKNINFCVISC